MIYIRDRKDRSVKKGVMNTIQISLLAVAAILILSLFLFSQYQKMKERMELSSCKASISAHEFVATKTANEFFTDIKCPTEEITIKNLKDAKGTIAEDMHRCWYIWGKGEGQYFEGEGTFCHICSIYQFADKRREIPGFFSYLDSQVMPAKYPGDPQGITYAQYFQGKSTAGAEREGLAQIDELAKIDYINTSQRYATIFVYASGKQAIQNAIEGGGRSTLGAAGMFGVLGGGAAIGVGVFIASNPVGWIVGGAIVVGAGVAAIWQSLIVKEPETVQFLIFRPYNAEELNNIGCEKMVVNQMSNAGP